MFDKVFRALLLILLSGFLMVAFRYAEADRYVFIATDVLLVGDRRTGTIYRYRGGTPPTFEQIDPHTGKRYVIPIRD